MSKFKLVFVLATLITFSCVPVQAEKQLPDIPKPMLIGEAYPALSGMDSIQVVIETKGDLAGDRFDKESLLERIESKLKDHNIEIFKPKKGVRYKLAPIPILRSQIECLNLKGVSKTVCRIQSSLQRQVCMPGQMRLKFKAEVWETEPVMQVLSQDKFSNQVNHIVLEQMEEFIQAYTASQSLKKDRPTSKSGDVSTPVLEKQTKSTGKTARTEYKYVASKNSKVFHKPSCSSAKRIKEENLVGYRSRQAAIDAGKRPCKICKP